ncbi:type II toxin-antitoxin system RelE/ParE family toxin [Cryomorphaceae bacterium 1068]|nr:type II toxin-antitoxin system RelE/ParE family toxin [Cryomorphaceae bacterium 1068]
MAKRAVVWTRTADIQFVGILQFWVEKNKSNSYSKRLMSLVSDRTKQIAKNPFLYKSADFKDTRVASLGHFSIYYKVFDDRIIVTAFWDNRQDPKKLLNILKNK